MAEAKPGSRKRKRERRNVSSGIVHIKSTFNNTIVSVTDTEGNVISWASSGGVGFSGSRKSTPFAAQMAAEKAGRAAMELGLRRAEVHVKGPGSGRDTSKSWHRSLRHQRSFTGAAQRVPSTKEKATISHGSLYRSESSHLTPSWRKRV